MGNYEKQNFQPGQILTAAQLNHIEDGIGTLSEEIAAIKNGVENVQEEILGFERYAKLPTDDTWKTNGKLETVEYITSISVRQKSSISGGRVYIDWETTKINGFVVAANLYNSAGVIEKRFLWSTGLISNPYSGNVIGDLSSKAWLDPEGATQAPFIPVKGPFSLPIPYGYSVEMIIRIEGNNLEFPDGTLTANAAYTWAHTGITVTVKTDLGVDTSESGMLTIAQEEACQRFAGLFKDSTGNVDSFVFFTDPHLCGSQDTTVLFGNYLNQIESVYSSIPASMCVCGGDWLTNGNTKENASWLLGKIDGAMKKRFNKYISIVGNHDTNYQGKEYMDSGADGTYDREMCEICSLSTTNIKNLWYREQGASYFSVKCDSSMYYVFDSGLDWYPEMDEYRWTQVEWFARSLQTDKPERCAILTHIVSTLTEVTPFVDEITKVAKAYNDKATVAINGNTYNFADTNGKCGFMLGGHKHTDLAFAQNGIPVVATTALQTNTDYPSFDLVMVDWAEMVLRLVRIGHGEDRAFNMIDGSILS